LTPHDDSISSLATADDHRLAAALAGQAGELLVELRARLVAEGVDPRRLKDEGDRRAHERLMDGLAARQAAGDAVLSEEGHDDRDRLRADRVWIVDPLDGTREYGEPPRTDWAVHVALTHRGRPVAGAVALPALGLVLSTAAPPPAPPASESPPRVIVSRSRPPAAATFLTERLGGVKVEMGSAGAKAMAVHASRIDGSPLVYNQAEPYLPDLLICRRELADAALAALTEFGPATAT